MTLTAADVSEIMRLVEQSHFDELTLEADGLRLVLRRGAAPVDSASKTAPAPHPATAAPAAAEPPVTRQPEPVPVAREVPVQSAPRTDPGVQDVVSPLLGTFYRAPKPGAPPFVEVGSRVDEDTVIAIVEVMKLMNSVRAGVRGTVTEILARDGTLVEQGEVLLRVRSETSSDSQASGPAPREGSGHG